MVLYGCSYVIANTEKIITFEAKTENAARLKMMRFAEKEDVHVQNLGKEVRKEG